MYGTGTRSYNRSTEKRTMDQERARITREHLAREAAQPSPEVECPMACPCCGFIPCHYRGRMMSLHAGLWKPPAPRLEKKH